MPYRRHEPVDESEMDINRWEGHHSVCQMLRDIYHMTDNPDIRLKLRLSMAMTKAMNEKLKWYKGHPDPKTQRDIPLSDDIHLDMEV